jgi:hypothetical protein
MSQLLRLARLPKAALLLGLAWILGLQGCDYFQPEAAVPSYIRIDSVFFQENGPDSTGYPSHRISDLWIYANNQIVGIFEWPTAKIPVLAEGNTRISIQAGVFTDGTRKSRVYYPFYRAFNTEVVLIKNQVSVLKPSFRYTPEKKKPFSFYQDFEASLSGCGKGDAGTASLSREFHEDSIPGNRFGDRYALLKNVSSTDILEIASEDFVPLKTNGDPVYLEFDYRSTTQMTVGLKAMIGNTPAGSVNDLILLPRSQWTKVYVSLADETQSYNSSAVLLGRPAVFRFFIRSSENPGSNQTFAIDNIRLIQ